jgi:O-antigen/teichoic acid export membrane protein
MLALIGVALAVIGLLGAGRLLSAVGVSADVLPEARRTLLVVLAALPFVTLASGLRGVLEACGRFDWSAAVRVVVGVVTYIGPVAAVAGGGALPAAVGTITAVRVAAVVAMAAMVAKLVVGRHPQDGPGDAWRALVHGGLWMTVASLAGAVLALVDRLVVGALVSVAAIAFYAAPQELIGRLTLVPMALGAVLFPALSAAATKTGDEAARLFARGLGWTFVVLAPIAAVLAAFAPEWLAVWLGPAFAGTSRQVVQWFSLSVLFQSLTVTPLNLLQASGQARAAAWLQVVQLPLFVAGLWAGTATAGITGAAVVWAIRTGVDLAAHLIWCRRTLPQAAGPAVRAWWVPLTATSAWFWLVTRIDGWQGRGALFLAGLALFAAFVPRLLPAAERARAWQLIAGGLGANRAVDRA